MITIKYEKKDPSIYVSHIDILRGMVRIIRRTGFIPEFSKGFNPHMLLFFSPPLAVGVSSECEYVSIDINNVEESDLLEAFNRSAPGGIKGIATFTTEKMPNLAGRIAVSDYVFPTKNAECTAEIAKYFKNNVSYCIEFVQKNECIVKDVRAQIKSVKVIDEGLLFTLATGNENLRADRLLAGLKKDFKLDTEVYEIVKKSQYILENGQYISVDDVLRRG